MRLRMCHLYICETAVETSFLRLHCVLNRVPALFFLTLIIQRDLNVNIQLLSRLWPLSLLHEGHRWGCSYWSCAAWAPIELRADSMANKPKTDSELKHSTCERSFVPLARSFPNKGTQVYSMWLGASNATDVQQKLGWAKKNVAAAGPAAGSLLYVVVQFRDKCPTGIQAS